MSDQESHIQKLLDDASFVRWIKGEASSEEQEKWDRWEREDDSHRYLKVQVKLLYKLPMAEDTGYDRDHQLARLNRTLDKREPKIWQLPLPRRRKKSAVSYAAATVALLLGILGVVFFYLHDNHPQEAPFYKTVAIDYGERGTIEVNDGSRIVLNSNSQLRYAPEQFNSSKIEVWLQGEGYFSITPNPEGHERSFIVHTPEGSIEVLGTKFNINTRNKQTGVVLEEGRVSLQLKDSLNQVRDEQVMKPGQMAVMVPTDKSIDINSVDAAMYTSWLDQKLVFDDTSLDEIVENIEQTYGVEIQIEGSDLADERIAGSVDNPDLETLLKGLSETLDIRVHRNGEQIIFSSGN